MDSMNTANQARGKPRKGRPRKAVGRGAKRLLIGLGIALLLGAAVCALLVLPPQTVSREVTDYSYRVTAGASYEVALVPNELFEEKRLPEGGIYASQLTEYIAFTLNAGFSGSAEAEITGDYRITAVVQGVQDSGGKEKIVYTKRFSLGEGTVERSSDTAAEITQAVQVRPDTYLQVAEAAARALGTSPKRQLYLLFEGSFSADTAYGSAEKPFSCQISIPLSKEAALYEITKQDVSAAEGGITRTEEAVTYPGPELWAVTTSMGVLALALLSFALFFTRPFHQEEQFAAQIRGIMRKYGSRMVRMERLPCFEESGTIPVAEIHQLVLLAEELRQPMLYSPDEDGGLRLYVPDAGRAYRLHLKKPDTTLEVSPADERSTPTDPSE